MPHLPCSGWLYMAQDADILLLDEPTTYMDVEYQLLLMNILKDLRDQGKTILMVLHDLPQALESADVVIAMDDGRIAALDIPGKIIESGIIEKIFHVKIRDTGEGYVYQGFRI